MRVRRPHGGLELIDREDAMGSGDGAHRQSRDVGVGAGLPAVDVGQLLGHHLLTGVRVRQHRGRVAHGTARHVESRLHADLLGRQFLQADHGGILAVDVVTHVGAVHRLPHGIGGSRDRVGTQVDGAVGHGPVLSVVGR
jgi:hypothetical protein